MDIKAIIFVILSLWIVVIPCITFLFPILGLFKKRVKIKRKYFENLFVDCYNILERDSDDILYELFDITLSPLVESYEGYVLANDAVTLNIYKLESEPNIFYWRLYDNKDHKEIDNDFYNLDNDFYFSFYNQEAYREVRYMLENIRMAGKEITKIAI